MIIIAHRGCRDDGFNQNTMRAFDHVCRQGVPAIEFDVQQTSDGHLVIVHNLDLSEVSTGDGLVSRTSSQQIRRYWAGDPSRGRDPIPFAEDLLALVETLPDQARPVLHMELKGTGTGIPAGRLVRDAVESGPLELGRFLISSFLWEELDDFKTQCPEADTALLAGAVNRESFLREAPDMAAWVPLLFAYPQEKFMLPQVCGEEELDALFAASQCPPEYSASIREEIRRACSGAFYDDMLIDQALRRGAVSLNLWHRSLSGEFVRRVHQAGLKVLAFTVNSEKDALRMKEAEVDGIFTDHFSRLKNFLAGRKS